MMTIQKNSVTGTFEQKSSHLIDGHAVVLASTNENIYRILGYTKLLGFRVTPISLYIHDVHPFFSFLDKA